MLPFRGGRRVQSIHEHSQQWPLWNGCCSVWHHEETYWESCTLKHPLSVYIHYHMRIFVHRWTMLPQECSLGASWKHTGKCRRKSPEWHCFSTSQRYVIYYSCVLVNFCGSLVYCIHAEWQYGHWIHWVPTGGCHQQDILIGALLALCWKCSLIIYSSCVLYRRRHGRWLMSAYNCMVGWASWLWVYTVTLVFTHSLLAGSWFGEGTSWSAYLQNLRG